MQEYVLICIYIRIRSLQNKFADLRQYNLFCKYDVYCNENLASESVLDSDSHIPCYMCLQNDSLSELYV